MADNQQELAFLKDQIKTILTNAGVQPANFAACVQEATGHANAQEAYNALGLDGALEQVKKWVLANIGTQAPKTSEKQDGATNPPKHSNSGQKTPAKAKEWQPLNEQEIRKKYTINTHGKEYLQVAGRVLLFRLKHSKGTITTELVASDETSVIFRASVIDEQGSLLGSAYAQSFRSQSKNFSGRTLEDCETSAVGRALAYAGFGTDAAGDDINEGDQLSDAPVTGR